MLSKNKKGMSLIEMIIAIAIFTIGIEGFSLLFVKTWKQNSFILEKGTASMAASRGVQKTVDVIRKARQADNGAYPIISANENDLVIYSDIDKDGVTEKVHYYLSGGALKAGITDPAGAPPAYPAGDQTVNDVSRYVVNTSAPVFSYYDSDNNLLTTPANVNEVRMVKVYLETNANPAHFPNNVDIQSFATIRNLKN
ncbi:prepilin-type N-terminal cleavage/methylation domain-containing protein [bacterium]|nr:prepilin-type N-terminal cleavage/methylation domain-containing protein [bacterium]